MEKKAFINLIESIKRKTGLNEEQISVRMNYGKGHIAQVKNRGPISDKFVNALKREFIEKKIADENEELMVFEPEAIYGNAMNPDYLIGIIKTQAETILNQQNMINTLTNKPSKKTA